jgi:murein DD-endopeptidase MepM/ murein hydrolase activator NlpD
VELTVECIDRVTTEFQTPFEVSYHYDSASYVGERGVIREGRPGLEVVTRERVLQNGSLISETETDRAVVRAPVSRVVSVGTKSRPVTASYGEYIKPADGPISSYFGYRASKIGSTNHKGLDISGSLGDELRAADGGEVIYSGDKFSGYGKLVQIRHDNGDVTYYAHCSELLASEGERVARGQTIALMGRTGVASGVHCHFEIRVNGAPVNPLPLIQNA